MDLDYLLEEAKKRKLNLGTKKRFDFVDPDPIRWMKRHFRVPETANKRLHLGAYQEACLREALKLDEEGKFVNSVILWSDIKKSIKSTLAAAVALWMAWQVEWGSVYIIANDLQQASSRVGYYIQRSIELHPIMREVCRVQTSRNRVLLPNETYIQSIPIDPSGEAGSNADMICFCLDDQSEILTKEGWKGWESLTVKDWVATRNPETGFFEWQQPESIYCEDYSGSMVSLETKRLSMLVTPNHRLYGKLTKAHNYSDGDWHTMLDRFVEARFAKAYYWHFPAMTSKGWNGTIAKERVEIPATATQPAYSVDIKDWVEFMAWYLSEGCLVQKKGEKPYGIAIAQSEEKNPKKRKRIIDLLTRMGLPFREWAGGISMVVWNVSLGEMLKPFGKAADKYIPEEIKDLSVEYLELFLKTYIDGDGCKAGNGWTIVTNSIQMRDDLMEIAQKVGYMVADWQYVDKRWEGKTIQYTVRVIPQDHLKTKVHHSRWKTVQYTGKVFCPSTKNGIIFMRRDGKCLWTGNSELWGAHQKAQARMWSELTLSPMKFGRSFRWIETYAGFTGESTLLENLYETGVKGGKPVEWADKFTPAVEAFTNESARMFALWNTHPRLPWQSDIYYSSEAAILEPTEFDRMHRNKWSSSLQTFVPAEWWERCTETAPALENNQSVLLAMDAAVSNDCFGLLMLSGRGDGNYDVRYSRKWKPPKGEKLFFAGEDGPEEEVRRLLMEYNVIEVCYDPYQLEDMAGRLTSELIGVFHAFNQGAARSISDKGLQDSIRDRRVHHNGEPDLTDHITNANAKTEGERIRLVKKADHMKIDLAVCLSMALDRAIYWGI